MLGMESMLASMLGVNPEELKAMAENAVNLLSTLDTRLSAIEKQVAETHALVSEKVLTNGESN